MAECPIVLRAEMSDDWESLLGAAKVIKAGGLTVQDVFEIFEKLRSEYGIIEP